MEAGEDVLAVLAQRQSLAQLGAGEDRAGRVDLDVAGARLGQGAELVQPDVHLVGDVAQVTAAAGGAAVVHLEAGDDAVAVHLDRLGVLAADVEDRPRAREEGVGAEPVAEDLGADLLLGKRQPRAAVPGADGRHLLELGVARRLHRRVDLRGVADALERAGNVMAEAELEGLVLDPDDALVIETDEEVEADAVGIGDLLRVPHVGRAGGVAKEVGPRRRIIVGEPRLLLGLGGVEDPG